MSMSIKRNLAIEKSIEANLKVNISLLNDRHKLVCQTFVKHLIL